MKKDYSNSEENQHCIKLQFSLAKSFLSQFDVNTLLNHIFFHRAPFSPKQWLCASRKSAKLFKNGVRRYQSELDIVKLIKSIRL
jgi:hypothetical protein